MINRCARHSRVLCAARGNPAISFAVNLDARQRHSGMTPVRSSSEPTARIELATLRLQGGRSAAELRRRACTCPKHALRATTSSPLRRNYTIRVFPVKTRSFASERELYSRSRGLSKISFKHPKAGIANSPSLWYNLACTALDGGVISHASGSPGSA